jgi:MFS family permease
MTAAASPATGRWPLVVLVAVTTAVQALCSLAALVVAAIAPKLGEALGVSASLVGWQIAIVYGGAMLTALAGGTVVRRFGACRTSQFALTLCGAGAALAAIPWLPAIAAASLLLGFGYGLTNPAASHLLARAASPASRNIVFSIKQTGVPLGGTMAGLLAPPMAVAFGWQWALLSVGLAGLLLTALMQPARAAWDFDRDPGTRMRENPLAGLGVVWRSGPLRWLSLAGFFYAAVQLSLTSFLVTMLVADVGMSLIEAGVLMSAVQVSGVVGRIFWGLLADGLRDGVKVLAILGGMAIAAAGATAALTAAWPAAAVWLVLLAFGASAIGWNGVYLAEIAHRAPEGQVPRATGGSLFFTYGGVLVGPPLFALAYQPVGSYTGTYGLAALVGAAGLVCVLAARRVTRPAA